MHLNAITLVTAIRDAAASACEKSDIGQLALGLLAEMADDTMRQDTMTLNIAINA